RVERPRPRRQVRARAERAPRARHDYRAHVVVRVGLVERVDHLVHHDAGESVELLRPIERDRRDIFRDLANDLFVRHRLISAYFTNSIRASYTTAGFCEPTTWISVSRVSIVPIGRGSTAIRRERACTLAPAGTGATKRSLFAP